MGGQGQDLITFLGGGVVEHSSRVSSVALVCRDFEELMWSLMAGETRLEQLLWQ